MKIYVQSSTGALCAALLTSLSLSSELLTDDSAQATLTVREDVPSEVSGQTIVLCNQGNHDAIKQQVRTVKGGAHHIIVLTCEGAKGYIKERLPTAV